MRRARRRGILTAMLILSITIGLAAGLAEETSGGDSPAPNNPAPNSGFFFMKAKKDLGLGGANRAVHAQTASSYTATYTLEALEWFASRTHKVDPTLVEGVVADASVDDLITDTQEIIDDVGWDLTIDADTSLAISLTTAAAGITTTYVAFPMTTTHGAHSSWAALQYDWATEAFSTAFAVSVRSSSSGLQARMVKGSTAITAEHSADYINDIFVHEDDFDRLLHANTAVYLGTSGTGVDGSIWPPAPPRIPIPPVRYPTVVGPTDTPEPLDAIPTPNEYGRGAEVCIYDKRPMYLCCTKDCLLEFFDEEEAQIIIAGLNFCADACGIPVPGSAPVVPPNPASCEFCLWSIGLIATPIWMWCGSPGGMQCDYVCLTPEAERTPPTDPEFGSWAPKCDLDRYQRCCSPTGTPAGTATPTPTPSPTATPFEWPWEPDEACDSVEDEDLIGTGFGTCANGLTGICGLLCFAVFSGDEDLIRDLGSTSDLALDRCAALECLCIREIAEGEEDDPGSVCGFLERECLGGRLYACELRERADEP